MSELPGIQVPDAHISMHAVLVRDAEAYFDEGALHGRSGVEAGVRWVDARAELPTPERWCVVWVAVTHETDGSRAYSGLTAAEIWIDARARLGFKQLSQHAATRDAALKGRVDLAPLGAAERQSLRRALVAEDPDAWDLARSEVQDACRAEGTP